ncbi:MAG: NADH:ubiquinone oxidoreductase, subunit RnfA [Ruminococcaceae bacterium]|nr:NADH:ubiquinone oxidoreductase, subunit RnfA [Oscillospiraceae bacterium]
MNDILKILVEFFAYSLIAIGAQNAIFTRALGLSSGMRMLNDPRKNTLYFCGALTVFQLMTSIIVYFVMPLVTAAGFAHLRRFVLPTVIVMACTVSYVIVIGLLSVIVSKERFKELLQSVTSASITGTIVGTVLLTNYQGMTLLQSIGFGLGSSVGYLFAMLLITEGDRKIAHDRVPESLRGLPITLVYISVLALAVYGLTGHAIAL